MIQDLIRVVNTINTELENRAVSLGVADEIDVPVITIQTDGGYILFKFCDVAIFGVEDPQELEGTADDLEQLLRRQVSELCAIIGQLGRSTS